MIKYLRSLFCKVVLYETTDVNGELTRSRWRFYLSRLTYLTIAIVCYIFLFKNGFSESFVSIYANILAILIGLLSATMLFGFESLQSRKETELDGKYEITIKDIQKDSEKTYIVNNEVLNNSDSRDNATCIQHDNYANQFVCFTGYNIVLCTLSLLSILFVSLFQIETFNPFNTYFVCFGDIEGVHIITFIIGLLVSFQRIFVLYAMGLIVKYTLFATTSLVHVMTNKMKIR